MKRVRVGGWVEGKGRGRGDRGGERVGGVGGEEEVDERVEREGGGKELGR